MARGKFITFEGLDGCGKSTQLKNLAVALRGQGLTVITTREPGGTEAGEKIRALILDSHTSHLSPWTELGLMFSSRAQQVDELILPALAAGAWVLCDRFTDSSEAYQGGGRELGSEPVLALHKILCHGLQPDLTILMVSDAAHSVSRARRRNLQRNPNSSRSSSTLDQGNDISAAVAGESAEDPGPRDENRFEQENREFFRRVLDAYLAISRREPERVVVVDALRPIPDVHRDIVDAVRVRLGLWQRTE